MSCFFAEFRFFEAIKYFIGVYIFQNPDSIEVNRNNILIRLVEYSGYPEIKKHTDI